MKPPLAYCLFETALGWCAIAWREPGSPEATPAVALLQLPEATPELTGQRIVRDGGTHPSDPPPYLSRIIRKVGRHFNGDPQDFQDIVLDLGGAGPFAQQVYAAARTIPAGETRTYGELAKAMGCPAAARAVGQALGKNPVALIIPCHRVLASGGKPGGFSAPGGLATKIRMLAAEGAAAGLPVTLK